MQETRRDEIPFDQPVDAQLQYIKMQVSLVAEGEVHEVLKLLCGRRDWSDIETPAAKNIVVQLEKGMRAFLARKKLGVPVTIRQIQEEFLPQSLK